MMATALGDVVSDGLEDGRIVSGVGGQYNFIAQSFALEGARSAIMLRATRSAKGRDESNIKWRYGHITIPRHLRDIIITEYGIADIRGKSDSEVIAAMLAITDSRFQDELLRQAKDAGKIARTFESAEIGARQYAGRDRARCSSPPPMPACCRCFHSAPISPKSSSDSFRHWRY